MATYMRPQPQPEAEERVRKTLKGMDELLDIKWFPIAVYRDGTGVEGRYALICQWPQGDKRWKLVYEGRYNEPFDVMAWFCEDLQSADSNPVNPDMLEERVIEFLGQCDNTRQPWITRMKQTMEKNLAVKRAGKDEMLDLAHDEFGYWQKKLAGEHIVKVGDLPADMQSPKIITNLKE